MLVDQDVALKRRVLLLGAEEERLLPKRALAAATGFSCQTKARRIRSFISIYRGGKRPELSFAPPRVGEVDIHKHDLSKGYLSLSLSHSLSSPPARVSFPQFRGRLRERLPKRRCDVIVRGAKTEVGREERVALGVEPRRRHLRWRVGLVREGGGVWGVESGGARAEAAP